MSITRESIVRGPGTVKLGSDQFFDKDGIEAALEISTYDVPVGLYGNVDTRRQDIVGRISTTPSGRINAAILSALFPYGNPVIGSSLGGSSDTALEVHSLAGTKVTFHSAFLSAMPQLRLTPRETAFGGAAEFIALQKNGVTRTADNSLYTVAASPWSGTFDKSDIKSVPYTAAWGESSPWDSIKTANGWTVAFDLGIEPVVEDTEGTIDYLLTSVTCTATCQPLGLSEANILDGLKAQGSGNAIGGSMRTSNDLVITGTGGLTVTLKEAALIQGPLGWGNTRLRAGEIQFVSHRSISSGTPGALFSVAMTPEA